MITKKKRQIGDYIAANSAERIVPKYAPGILVEKGDRVQFKTTRLFAQWGTIVKNRGFGRAYVELDNGNIISVPIGDLQFEKCGRPAIQPKEAK